MSRTNLPTFNPGKEKTMIVRLTLAALVSAAALLTATGCSVARDQQSMGEYVDDATLTTRVKAKFASDPAVSALAISVDTFNGEVQLSGAAKSTQERTQAETLARSVAGVKSVRNDIIVRG
jgi:hyperosmotically inducible protein